MHVERIHQVKAAKLAGSEMRRSLEKNIGNLHEKPDKKKEVVESVYVFHVAIDEVNGGSK